MVTTTSKPRKSKEIIVLEVQTSNYQIIVTKTGDILVTSNKYPNILGMRFPNYIKKNSTFSEVMDAVNEVRSSLED